MRVGVRGGGGYAEEALAAVHVLTGGQRRPLKGPGYARAVPASSFEAQSLGWDNVGDQLC
jgi:hypothetical protein